MTTTSEPETEPVLSSYGGVNLKCRVCGKTFYSESAVDMVGRACATTGCAGLLEPNATPAH